MPDLAQSANGNFSIEATTPQLTI